VMKREILQSDRPRGPESTAEVVSCAFPSSELTERARSALAYYEAEVEFYEHASHRNFLKHRRLKTASILFGFFAPIFILAPVPPYVDPSWWKVVQALPAAIAAVSTTIAGEFNYRDDFARQAHTVNALRSEHAAFMA